MTVSIDRALRLRTLWLAWLLCMFFHVDPGLMPLFHGLSPEIESHVGREQLPLLFSGMLIDFLVPVAALVLLAYSASDPQRWQGWRRLHFWLIGLLINWEAWRWWRDYRSTGARPAASKTPSNSTELK